MSVTRDSFAPMPKVESGYCPTLHEKSMALSIGTALVVLSIIAMTMSFDPHLWFELRRSTISAFEPKKVGVYPFPCIDTIGMLQGELLMAS